MGFENKEYYKDMKKLKEGRPMEKENFKRQHGENPNNFFGSTICPKLVYIL